MVVVIPLLYETGGEDRFDSVACVASSFAIQMERLQRRGISVEEARQRIQAQEPLEGKIRKSRIVLWNSGSMELLHRQIEQLEQYWLSHEQENLCQTKMK